MSTGTLKQKVDLLQAARALKAKGYNIFATGGSSKFLAEKRSGKHPRITGQAKKVSLRHWKCYTRKKSTWW